MKGKNNYIDKKQNKKNIKEMALCSIKPRVKVKKEKRKKGEQNTHWFGYICWRDKKTDRPTDIDRSKDRYMDR